MASRKRRIGCPHSDAQLLQWRTDVAATFHPRISFMTTALTHFTIRPEWLAATVEPALDPAQPVVDAHHHLYDRPGIRYLLHDYLADIQPGHDIRASVAVQARAMLRVDGPL